MVWEAGGLLVHTDIPEMFVVRCLGTGTQQSLVGVGTWSSADVVAAAE